jgi:hypothetical protein
MKRFIRFGDNKRGGIQDEVKNKDKDQIKSISERNNRR